MRVLVAIDSTENERSFAEFICRHNWQAPVQYLLVHVVSPLSPPVSQPISVELVEEVHGERQRWGRHVLDQLARAIQAEQPQAEIETLLLEGDPKEEILRAAENWESDVIVLSSHGRSFMGRFLLGSVSLAVLTQATCSVIVVRPSRSVLNHESYKAMEEASI